MLAKVYVNRFAKQCCSMPLKFTGVRLLAGFNEIFHPVAVQNYFEIEFSLVNCAFGLFDRFCLIQIGASTVLISPYLLFAVSV